MAMERAIAHAGQMCRDGCVGMVQIAAAVVGVCVGSQSTGSKTVALLDDGAVRILEGREGTVGVGGPRRAAVVCLGEVMGVDHQMVGEWTHWCRRHFVWFVLSSVVLGLLNVK